MSPGPTSRRWRSPCSQEATDVRGAYWFRNVDGTSGISFELYDTGGSARAVLSDPPQVPPDPPVKLVGVEPCTVEAGT